MYGLSSVVAVVACLACIALPGCRPEGDRLQAVQNAIKRYNELLSEGYRKQDMTQIQEVAVEEQALKLYHHMSALGEGRLRMDSVLKDIQFLKVEFPLSEEAVAETREVWDFTHYRQETGEKFAEERNFVYGMEYKLNKRKGKWIINQVTTISGTSTNTIIPWPKIDRKGDIRHSGAPGHH